MRDLICDVYIKLRRRRYGSLTARNRL